MYNKIVRNASWSKNFYGWELKEWETQNGPAEEADVVPYPVNGRKWSSPEFSIGVQVEVELASRKFESATIIGYTRYYMGHQNLVLSLKDGIAFVSDVGTTLIRQQTRPNL